jgi:hypothetical protein
MGVSGSRSALPETGPPGIGVTHIVVLVMGTTPTALEHTRTETVKVVVPPKPVPARTRPGPNTRWHCVPQSSASWPPEEVSEIHRVADQDSKDRKHERDLDEALTLLPKVPPPMPGARPGKEPRKLQKFAFAVHRFLFVQPQLASIHQNLCHTEQQ